MGVRDALEKQWAIYTPGFTEKSQARIRQVARKAWRFSGEMKEIAATMEAAGLPREFFDAAAQVYERQKSLKDAGQEPDDRRNSGKGYQKIGNTLATWYCLFATGGPLPGLEKNTLKTRESDTRKAQVFR